MTRDLANTSGEIDVFAITQRGWCRENEPSTEAHENHVLKWEKIPHETIKQTDNPIKKYWHIKYHKNWIWKYKYRFRDVMDVLKKILCLLKTQKNPISNNNTQ